MAAARHDYVTFPVPLRLTDTDLDTIHEMMRAGGFTTVEALVLHSVYRFGQHLDAGIPLESFPARMEKR
jgi:hypothetical protein